jgi:hypothetical protein
VPRGEKNRGILKIMENEEIQICKRKILKCLTETFEGNQAIFDHKRGYQIFAGTDLIMVMNAVTNGLKLAQSEINNMEIT